MKRIALIIVCFLVMFVFTACITIPQTTPDASNANETEPPTENDVELIFTWWGNQTRNERTQAILDMYTEMNPNVKFDAQFAEWADYWNKLATASAAHNLPDIIQMDYKYIRQYVNNDLLVDLSPYTQSGALDLSDVDEGIIASGSLNNKLYAICAGVNAPALVYNKTLLNENGITVKDNLTIDEFVDLCREIYEATGYKSNLAYGIGEGFIEYLMRGYNIQLFEDDRLGVESPADLEKFFTLYENGMNEGWHVHPSIFAERTISSIEQDPLVYGTSPETRSWCGFNTSNQLNAYKNAAPEGIELGITTWPSPDPKSSNYLKPSQFFSVSVDSKHPEEAAKVIDYITNSVECNEILLGERGVPASSKIADSIAPLLDSTNKQIISYINNVVTPNCSAINPPAPDSAIEVFTIINELEEKLCYGQLTAKEAAEELFAKGNEILSKGN